MRENLIEAIVKKLQEVKEEDLKMIFKIVIRLP